jgi:hypothetical protein
LIADRSREARTVDDEGVARVRETSASLLPQQRDLGCGVEEGQVITLRGEGAGQVAGFFPIPGPATHVGAIALDLNLESVLGVEHAAALGPERKQHFLLTQVGLALQVQRVLPAPAAGVGNRRRRDGALQHVGVESIGACFAGARPGRFDRLAGVERLFQRRQCIE